MNRRTQTLALCWLAAAAAIAGHGCGGILEIRRPPDGGSWPVPDSGWPDAGNPDPPGAPSQSRTTLEVTPTATVVADGLSRAFLRVTVRDAVGRLVPGTNVTFSATGAANLFIPGIARGTTGSDGSVTVSLASTRAEVKTVTAALAAFSVTAQVTFIAGPPSVSNSQLQLAPSTVVADGVQTANLLVIVQDRSGNPVGNTPVSFVATGTSNVFAPPSGPSDTNGRVSSSLASTRAEPKTVVATVSGAFVLTQPVTFQHGPASLATSSIVASPTVLVADGVTATTVRVVVRDAQGNPLPGQTVVFTVSPSGEATSPPSAPTNVDGEVTTQLASTIAETKTITALAAGLTLQATVRFGPGAPSTTTSTLTANPTSLPADGTQTTLLTFTFRDDAGNPFPGGAVALTATGSANRFTPDPPSGTSDVSGVFTARLSSTVAEAKTVFATTAGFTLSTPVTFTVGPPSQTNSRFSANPQQVVANGSDTTTMTVVVRDANGNPVPGQSVAFSSTGTGNTITSPTATTNAAGSAAATLRSTRAELKTLGATFAGLTLQTAVSFVSGPPSQSRSSLVALPNRYTTDDFPGTTVTTTIKDANGNPLQSKAVDLSASGGGNSWSIEPPSGDTDVNGVFAIQLTSSQVGSRTITAIGEGLTLTTSVTVDPGVPSLITMDAQPDSLRADGVQTSLVTVSVTDYGGNPVPGYSARLETFDPATWVDSPQGMTNAQGTFGARLKSTVPGTKTVYGYVGTISWLATVDFTP